MGWREHRPREVEEALYAHDGVVDCAVFGIPDERSGERLKAMVEMRPGTDVTVDALESFVRERLADYKVPKEWELVDELPRDSTGKVRKRGCCATPTGRDAPRV